MKWILSVSERETDLTPEKRTQVGYQQPFPLSSTDLMPKNRDQVGCQQLFSLSSTDLTPEKRTQVGCQQSFPLSSTDLTPENRTQVGCQQSFPLSSTDLTPENRTQVGNINFIFSALYTYPKKAKKNCRYGSLDFLYRMSHFILPVFDILIPNQIYIKTA